MANTSNQRDELTKGIVPVVEHMLKEIGREVVIDKAIDHKVAIAGQFYGENITDFLANIGRNKGISQN